MFEHFQIESLKKAEGRQSLRKRTHLDFVTAIAAQSANGRCRVQVTLNQIMVKVRGYRALLSLGASESVLSEKGFDHVLERGRK